MARRPPTTPTQPPAQLLVSTNEARERLISRRDSGQVIYSNQTNGSFSANGLDDAKQEYGKWNSYNLEMLRRMFDTEEYAQSYSGAGVGMVISFSEKSMSEKWKDHLVLFKRKLDFLDSLAERVELIDVSPHADRKVEQPVTTSSPEQGMGSLSNTKVFLVHGQDNETKSIVARFIEHCGLRPIILHEQTDQGRTIIEKFEQNADVGFAVILLTPDDVGCLRADAPNNLKARSRQNVILELGYFIGRLGRSRVCALKKGEVDLPSDFSGVVYTPYDGADEGWKIKLAREMRAAGLNVDLNAALG